MRFQKLQNAVGSKLRNRFILFFIIIASVPVMVLGGVSLYVINFSHRYDVSSLEIQLIDQKIKEIQKFFADTLGLLELVVSTDNTYIDAGDQAFLLDGLLKENYVFEQVSFIESKRGRETSKKLRNEKPGEEMAFEDISRLEKFKRASMGENFIGPIYHTLSGPFVSMSSPVRNRNGEIISIVSAEVNLSSLLNSIETVRLGSAGYLVLLDRNGDFIGGGGPATIVPGTALWGWSRAKEVLAGKVFNALGNQDRYESFFGTVPVVGAGKKIPEIEWALLIEWPLQDADAIIRQIRNQVIQFTLFSILAVLFIAPFFANRLIKPIRELKHSAAEIEQGNFEKQVVIKTGDELEELGSAFNRMAEGLKRLQELKNEFVFIAAHELRSPVTIINGYISMIVRDKAANLLTAELKDYLDQIKYANERLLQLVANLLEVARSEAGRLVIEVVPLTLEDCIHRIISEMKPLGDEKSIMIQYEQLPNLPRVLANDTRVKEIMVNLIGNAIKYSPQAKPIIVSHEIKEKEVITLVRDNGFGMSEVAQKKLFEKFYRVKTKETQSIPGTGLGLFIVKQLIEKMNGTIGVVSQEGKGSTFSFSLPRV
ncbi:MAG: sensor histidine kinase [Patescibacteria group bacterium]